MERKRLAAILAADAAGYSRLMAADQRNTLALLDSCRAIFQRHVAARGGRIVDTAGDSVLAIFDSASAAVQAGLAVQKELDGARFGGRTSAFAANVWTLSQAILMLLCCFSPRMPSRGMLIALLTASIVIVTSFALGVAGALGRLARDDYPIPVSSVYIVEITIAAWFIYKHRFRVRG